LKWLLDRKAGALAFPVQFALVGVSGMVLDLLAFALLGFRLPLAVARALALWLAMTWNYALNRQVTFAAYRQDFRWRDYALFCGSCLAGALVSWSICMALCAANGWFARHPLLAALPGVAAGFALNYSLSRRFVFRPETAGGTAAPVPAVVPAGIPRSNAQAFWYQRVITRDPDLPCPPHAGNPLFPNSGTFAEERQGLRLPAL
jgi:putative flippase GtrA